MVTLDPQVPVLGLSHDELLVLAGVARLPGRPAPVRDQPDLELSAEVRAAVLRGLVARGILSVTGEGNVAIDDDIAELVRLLCAPGLTVRLDVESGDGVSVQHLYAEPDRAVLAVPDGLGGERYLPMAPPSLLEHVFETTGVTDRQRPDAEGGFTVTMQTLVDASSAMAELRRVDAVEVLRSAGVGAVAETYVDAILDHHVGSRSVTSIHRADGILTGTVTAWTDCGPAGLWLVDQDDPFTLYAPRPEGSDASDLASAPVIITPVSGRQLAERIRAGFPG